TNRFILGGFLGREPLCADDAFHGRCLLGTSFNRSSTFAQQQIHHPAAAHVFAGLAAVISLGFRLIGRR
ncbi:MAG TPA: hypothetical protein VMF69_26580, partial [Gemmataceae bacterium]|nr:hypothetical protein [Gemmataceae bacterium]